MAQGRGPGQFYNPYGVAVDASGNVYVAAVYNHRIQKFTTSGGYITQWGSNGSGQGQFYFPWGVAVDAGGNVYVADEMNNRIQMFCYGQTAVQNTTWGRVKSMFR
jgi:DNA-binding beta-propeller fold protein YncE